MPTIKQGIGHVTNIEEEFMGTIAFRNEKITLPDGSKVAIGIDGERWVIVYQTGPKMPFVVYEFNAKKQTVIVDKKLGSPEEIEKVREIVKYFFENAQVDDVVTIEPGGV